jgi:hypothetical protein
MDDIVNGVQWTTDSVTGLHREVFAGPALAADAPGPVTCNHRRNFAFRRKWALACAFLALVPGLAW